MRDDGADLAELIERIAARDRQGFAEFYRSTAPRLMAIALRVLGRRDLAEEALQDTYLAIWEQARRFDRARGSAFGWAATIARRRAVDRLRASPWLARECPDFAEDAVPAPDLPATQALRQCLGRLEARARFAICLAYLYGMTHRELSAATSTPLGTLKSLIRRGVIALKRCLDP